LRGFAVVAVTAVLAMQSCAGASGCSDVGGFDGVGVEIPRALFVKSGSVAFEVCDDADCAAATQRLGTVPEGRVGRGVDVTFDELGRRFEPGSVNVRVELSDSRGQVVAAARRPVELTRSYPNGKSCDGEGYVGGVLALTAGDRV
jgi:hypothetical protein